MLPQGRLGGSSFGMQPDSIGIDATAFPSEAGLVQKTMRPTVQISQNPRWSKEPS